MGGAAGVPAGCWVSWGGGNTSQGLRGLGLHNQPVLLALPALGRREELLGPRRPVPHAEGLTGSLGTTCESNGC